MKHQHRKILQKIQLPHCQRLSSGQLLVTSKQENCTKQEVNLRRFNHDCNIHKTLAHKYEIHYRRNFLPLLENVRRFKTVERWI